MFTLQRLIFLITTLASIHHACAAPEPAASYSVIDVDGGSGHQTAGIVIEPTTIYQTVTTTAPTPTGVTVSITVTNQQTQTQTETITETITASVVFSLIESYTTTVYAAAPVPTTVADDVTTLSTVPTGLLPVSYDNGMWHTSYPPRASTTATTLSTAYSQRSWALSSASASVAVSSPTAAVSPLSRRGSRRRDV